VVSLAIAIMGWSSICNSQVRDGKPLAVVPEAIDRVEILYFPERILTRTALTPEKLERQYQYKIEIRELGASPQRQQLLAALHGASIVPSGRPCDVRTAVLLYDKSGKRLLSLYFERGGKNGAVNDKFAWKLMMRGFAD
jgi:hypothetical protein